MRAVKGEVEGADPQGYADDVGLTSQEPCSILQACGLTEEFADLTGTQVNCTKSHVWATTTDHRKVLESQCSIGGQQLTLVTSDRRLGAI